MTKDDLKTTAEAFLSNPDTRSGGVERLTDILDRVHNQGGYTALREVISFINQAMDDSPTHEGSMELLKVKRHLLEVLEEPVTLDIDALEKAANDCIKGWKGMALTQRWYSKERLNEHFAAEDSAFMALANPVAVLALIKWIRRVDPALKDKNT